MRLGLALSAFAVSLLPSASLAASIRVCAGIELRSPAIGQHFIGTRPIHFSWSGEPVGTASRELRLATLDGNELVVPLDGRFSDTVRVKMTGDMGWAVVFKDADGNILCSSPAGLLHKGARGGKVGVSTGASSLATGTGGAAVTAPPAPVSGLVVGFTNDGRLVIVLQGTPYTGPYSKMVNGDDYDGRNEDLMGAKGIEFHGNNAPNVVWGSPGHDLIFLYDGNDWAEGQQGDDIIVGGNGNDELRDDAFGGDADVLYGGPGNDYLDVFDGDANDIAYGGTGFDVIGFDPGDVVSSGGPDGP
jgi:Ca2+-binding RTX toxin-like protein